VRAGREAENDDASVGIAEAGDRFAPVVAIAIGAALFPCDLFAISNQSRTASTGNNFAVEIVQPERKGHGFGLRASGFRLQASGQILADNCF
jgi:hypothetical protein